MAIKKAKKNILSRIEALRGATNEAVKLLVQTDSYDCEGMILDFVSKEVDGVMAKDEMGQRYRIENMDRIKRAVLSKNFDAKRDLVTSSKRPTTKARYLGIEMEIISKLNQSEMQIAMIEAGLENHVEVKDDSSIDTTDTHEFSHELCVLVKESEVEDVIKRVCAVLDGNSKVNKSCGLHVHIDMRDRNVNRAYMNLFESQRVL